MFKIAIFASGAGSNALKILEYFHKSNLADISLILTNNRNAGVLNHARSYDIPYEVLPNSSWEDGREAFKVLEKHKIDLIVLAGFLRKIPENLIKAYPYAIVNIHPALLPKYGGKGMYGRHVHEAVSSSGDRETGISIHWVNENYDEGNIIRQEKVSINPGEAPESIQSKVHDLEHRYFPDTIASLLNNWNNRENYRIH